MQDIAMYLLDITNNSIRANSTLIEIHLIDSIQSNRLYLEIKDNGNGMSEEVMKRVIDPFYTTRTTRKIGLGVAFFKELANQCNGEFHLESKVNIGTTISVNIPKKHWDTPPLGDIPESLITLIQADETIRYIYHYESDSIDFIVDTSEVKKILEDVSILDPSILLWIKDYIKEGMTTPNT